jgi:hypothetical protein
MSQQEKEWSYVEATCLAKASYHASQHPQWGIDLLYESFVADLLYNFQNFSPPHPRQGRYYDRTATEIMNEYQTMREEIKSFKATMNTIRLANPYGVSEKQQTSMAVAIQMNKTNSMDDAYKNYKVTNWKYFGAYEIFKGFPTIQGQVTVETNNGAVPVTVAAIVTTGISIASSEDNNESTKSVARMLHNAETSIEGTQSRSGHEHDEDNLHQGNLSELSTKSNKQDLMRQTYSEDAEQNQVMEEISIAAVPDSLEDNNKNLSSNLMEIEQSTTSISRMPHNAETSIEGKHFLSTNVHDENNQYIDKLSESRTESNKQDPIRQITPNDAEQNQATVETSIAAVPDSPENNVEKLTSNLMEIEQSTTSISRLPHNAETYVEEKQSQEIYEQQIGDEKNVCRGKRSESVGTSNSQIYKKPKIAENMWRPSIETIRKRSIDEFVEGKLRYARYIIAKIKSEIDSNDMKETRTWSLDEFDITSIMSTLHNISHPDSKMMH